MVPTFVNLTNVEDNKIYLFWIFILLTIFMYLGARFSQIEKQIFLHSSVCFFSFLR